MNVDDAERQPAGELERAVTLLRAGGTVAFPTETVYGLGADARNPAAVERIFTIKGRPNDHPLIVHIQGEDELSEWSSDVPEAARLLAQQFWPGPLTLILPGSLADPRITGGQKSVGLRAPRHPIAQALLRAFKGGLAAPSANRFGRISPTRAQDVRSELGSAVDLVLEGGACAVGLESTILSLAGPRPEILRVGSITRSALEGVLGESIKVITRTQNIRASGLLESHYAPITPLRLMDRCDIESLKAGTSDQWAILSIGEPALSLEAPGIRQILMPEDPATYGHRLYATLRALDQGDFTLLIAERPPSLEPWAAALDRLTRASHSSTA